MKKKIEMMKKYEIIKIEKIYIYNNIICNNNNIIKKILKKKKTKKERERNIIMELK